MEHDENFDTSIKQVGMFMEFKMPAPKKSRRTERGDLISYFSEKMNASRIKGGYKPLSLSGWSYKLSIFKTDQLYALRKKCDESVNFGRTFNYYVFPKKGSFPQKELQ